MGNCELRKFKASVIITIEAGTLTIPPPMQLKFSIGTFINIVNKKWAQILTAATWP
jgi:hypothetical protein